MMGTSAFRGLMKKEWLLQKNIFFLLSFGMLLMWSAGFGWSAYSNQPVVLLIITVLLFSFHILYMTWMVGSGLDTEGKSQNWLHSPRSTAALLGSKFLAAFCLHLASLLIAVLLLTVTMYVVKSNIIGQMDIDSFHLLSILTIALQLTKSGIELALFYMFYWSVYHAMGRYQILTKHRLVFFILFIIVFHTAFLLVENQLVSGINMFIPSPIPIPYETANLLSFYIQEEGMSLESGSNVITAGGVIIFLLKAGGFFYLSAWLLDKVVETK
jgi:hypothetical protein